MAKTRSSSEITPQAAMAKTRSRAQPQSSAKSDIVRCPCGIRAHTDRHVFIRCDTCNVWQHNIYVGFSDEEQDNPPQCFCEQCQPDAHPLLMQWSTKGLKKMRDFVRVRNERAQLIPNSAEERANKKAWLVLECNLLIDRVKELENYWHLCVTSETAPVEDERLVLMKAQLLVAIKAVVLRICLPDVEEFWTNMLKCLHETTVLQVEVMWELKKQITALKMLASWQKTNDVPTEESVRRFFDLPR